MHSPERYRHILDAEGISPLPDTKLDLLGRLLGLDEGMRLLDLACGGGELLVRWARNHLVIGVGVDASESLIESAREHAHDMEVLDQLTFVVDDPVQYPQPFHQFDVVTCINGTHIGGGLVGTLDLMRTALVPRSGTAVVGLPYWQTPPTTEVCAALGLVADTYADLSGTLDRVEAAGMELVEMVLASGDERDRYESARWLTADTWLRANADHPDAPSLYDWLRTRRRRYLAHERAAMGWGVFVLRL